MSLYSSVIFISFPKMFESIIYRVTYLVPYKWLMRNIQSRHFCVSINSSCRGLSVLSLLLGIESLASLNLTILESYFQKP